MSRSIVAASSVLAVMAVAGIARAQQAVRMNPWVDGAITAGAAAVLFSAQSSVIHPEGCRWCASNALDDAGRQATRWHKAGVANRLSSSFAYATLPSAVIGGLLLASHDQGRIDQLPADLFMVAEATIMALAVNQVTKLAVARARPRTRPFGHDPAEAPEADDNLSFFSGHATLAYSLATAAGTVATLRRYRFADWVWASGLVLATSVAYLRMAADQHYFTDVAVGALVGSAMGVAVPLLLHAPKAPVRLAPGPGSLFVVGAF